jgi:hypothetical protein
VGLPGNVAAAAYFVVAEATTNAAKYAQASHATVSVRRQNGAMVVEVRDDGIGGADPAEGSGLRGLADRVSALDGQLEVHSEAGGAPPSGPASMRVVLAEDSVLLRQGFALILEQAGLQVVGQTGDAHDLVRQALDLHPDAAVVDIRMPPTDTTTACGPRCGSGGTCQGRGC